MKIKTILNAECEKYYHIYYDKKGNLILDKTKLASDATNDFDALLFKGKLQIVYKDRLNSIYYVTENGKRMILKSKNVGKIRIQNMRLWVYRTHLLLFYVMFYNHKNMLCCQNLSKVSEPPQVIDLCKNAEFYIQSCSDEKFYILYTAQENTQLTIRKFNGSWTAPSPICKGEFLHFNAMTASDEGLMLELDAEQLPQDLLLNMHNNL